MNDGIATTNSGYTFTINLNDPCNSITPPSSPSAYTFNIMSSDYTWTVPAWTKHADCAATETLTVTPDVTGASYPYISLSGRTFTISSSTQSLHMTSAVTFTVKSTLSDSNGTNNSGYTFAITLVDPCLTITPPASPSSYTYLISTGPY